MGFVAQLNQVAANFNYTVYEESGQMFNSSTCILGKNNTAEF